MTIRQKLLLLIGVTSGGIIVSVLIVVAMYMPLTRMQKEQRQLFALESLVGKAASAIAAAGFEKLEPQMEKVRELLDESDRQFETIGNFTALPDASETIALSLSTIQSLRTGFEEDRKGFDKKIASVIEDMRSVPGVSPGEDSLFSIYRIGQNRSNSRNWRILIADINMAMDSIQLLVRDLEAVLGVMQGEFSTIDGEIERLEQRVFLGAGLLFALISISGLVVAMIIASGISRNVLRLGEHLDTMGRGDLTGMVKIKSRDDLGKLGGGMNSFTTQLHSLISEVQGASYSTVDAKNRLLNALNRTRERSEKIGYSIDRITEEMGRLEERMVDSSASVELVSTHSGEILGMLQEHAAMVEESSAAITEMISSIASVASLSTRHEDSISRLIELSSTGSDMIAGTAELIEKAVHKSDVIREATAVIGDVAEQTALLSMNAAVEAARAGDKGAGFSVVAAEIRKLSVASGESSNRIGTLLEEVIEAIEAASSAGSRTIELFDENKQVVEKVAGALQGIGASMKELDTGGRQILEAITLLREFSSGLEERGREMKEASVVLQKNMEYTGEASANVVSRMIESAEDVEEIDRAISSLTTIAGELNGAADRTGRALLRFDVGDKGGNG